MTELLERAITAVKKLPPEVQDAIAARLLSEVDDEQAWNVRFTTTTDAQWDCLADKVIPLANRFYYLSAAKMKSKPVKEAN